MADETACPDGVPWCTRHLGGALALHRSGSGALPLRHRGREFGDASACAVQLGDHGGSEVTVSVQVGGPFWPDGKRAGSVFLDAHNREFAETVARLFEWLALATPAQHRKLAAQVRDAADVAFGNPPETEGEDRD